MAQEFKELARRMDHAGYKEAAQVLRGVTTGLVNAGLIPSRLPMEETQLTQPLSPTKDVFEGKVYKDHAKTKDGEFLGGFKSETGEYQYDLIPQEVFDERKKRPGRIRTVNTDDTSIVRSCPVSFAQPEELRAATQEVKRTDEQEDLATQSADLDPRLQFATIEYKVSPHSAERVTKAWKTVWTVWGEKLGKTIDVPPCDRTDEEIQDLEQRNKTLIFVPESLGDIENARDLLPLFGELPPSFHNQVLTVEPFRNVVDQHGWLAIENKADVPFVDPTEEVEVRRKLEDGTLEGQTVNTYLIGSLFHKITEGSFFDEAYQIRNTSQLLGSRMGHSSESVKTPRYIPYAQSVMRSGEISQLMLWSYGGAISPATIRTAEKKDPTPLVPESLPRHWDMNVLYSPPTAEEWNTRLGNNTGEAVAQLLAHIHEPETILPLSAPVKDADKKVQQALNAIGVAVSKVQMVSVERLGRERVKTIFANLIYPYARDRYDVKKSVDIGFDFFDKLYDDGIFEKFAHDDPHVQTLWQTYKSIIHYEASLLASEKPDDAAKITPFRELCEQGNYPVGIDSKGNLRIVTA